MKQLFYYIIIRLTTRHAINAVKIFERIYHPESSKPVIVINNTQISGNPKSTTHKPVLINSTTTLPNTTSIGNRDQKKELIDSLKYLKSKGVKSKQDKSSISMLEGVLASMS